MKDAISIVAMLSVVLVGALWGAHLWVDGFLAESLVVGFVTWAVMSIVIILWIEHGSKIEPRR
jgi:hypothetical protein